MADSFGFSESKKKMEEKLARIKPSRPDPKEVPLDRIDAVGDAHGFPSRESQSMGSTQFKKRKRDKGPRVAINMMAPEKVALPFIQFCDENRYTYWEGIEELMRRAALV